MQSEDQTKNDNSNFSTLNAAEVRQAITEVERLRKMGTPLEDAHIATLIQGAVAYIDQDRRNEQAPSSIRWRLERIEKNRDSAVMLTRDEVLQTIVDLRTMVDLYEKTRQAL